MILLLLSDDFAASLDEEIINHLNLPYETFCNILFIALACNRGDEGARWYEDCNFRCWLI